MNQRHPQSRHTPHGGSEKTDCFSKGRLWVVGYRPDHVYRRRGGHTVGAGDVPAPWPLHATRTTTLVDHRHARAGRAACVRRACGIGAYRRPYQVQYLAVAASGVGSPRGGAGGPSTHRGHGTHTAAVPRGVSGGKNGLPPPKEPLGPRRAEPLPRRAEPGAFFLAKVVH